MIRAWALLTVLAAGAAGQTYEASSHQSDRYHPRCAFDGQRGTRWSAKFDRRDGGWIQVTYDEPRVFSSVHVYSGIRDLKGAPKDFEILAGDGDALRVVGAISGNTRDDYTVRFRRTRARTWRLRIKAVVNSRWSPTISEIRFGSSGARETAAPEGAAATSSTPGLAGREAAMAFDGDRSTRYESSTKTSSVWLAVKLDEPAEYDAVRLHVNAEGGFGVPRAFAVQARTGTRWSTLARRSDSFTNTPWVRFKKTRAREWRVQVTELVDERGALRMNEVEFLRLGKDGTPETEAPTVKQTDVNRAIDSGVTWLQKQRKNGIWTTRHTQDYPMGVMALVGLALRKSGLERDDATLLDLVKRLDAMPLTKTYSVSLYAMFLRSMSKRKYLRRLEECAEFLVESQANDGLWGYPEGRSDLSCAQFALLGLDAAADAGVKIPSSVWKKSWDWILDGAKDDGGFNYCPHGARAADAPTGSMTVAALACLKICERRLPNDGGRGRTSKKVIDRAFAWVAERFVVEMNPGSDQSHYYWLYGVERVGAFHDVRKIGQHAWYPAGARHLVDWQRADGSWHRSIADTCFALLFLNRASVTRD